MNLRPFQIVMLALFAILAVVGIILLSTFESNRQEEAQKYGAQVLIWGTLEERAFRNVIDEIENTDEGFAAVEYRQVDSRSFNDTLVTAIAEGRSPDLILLPSSELVRQRNRLIAISYEQYPLRDFKDINVDGAEIFALENGVYAVPLLVNPIVMFWNRDLFASNGLAQAPTSWEYIVDTVAPALTRTDSSRNVLQATLAFGEVRNVQNAKEMLLMLAMQAGSKLIYENQNRYVVELNSATSENGSPPLVAATQFYTSFSNSNSSLYNWNRSEPLDRNAFTSGELGMYFGFASELESILEQNPNLNFDMTAVPQGASATVKRTYGEFYGLAIPRASQNAAGAFAVAQVLADPQAASFLAESLGMAPVARTSVAGGSINPFRQVILSAALIARGWLDPNSAATDAAFQDMIEDVTSGRQSPSSSVADAEQRIRLAF